MGGPHILYAESSQIRNQWKNKLEEALGLRKIVRESNKFEVEYLSMDWIHASNVCRFWAAS